MLLLYVQIRSFRKNNTSVSCVACRKKHQEEISCGNRKKTLSRTYPSFIALGESSYKQQHNWRLTILCEFLS